MVLIISSIININTNELNKNINMILLRLRFETIKCSLLESGRYTIQELEQNRHVYIL